MEKYYLLSLLLNRNCNTCLVPLISNSSTEKLTSILSTTWLRRGHSVFSEVGRVRRTIHNNEHAASSRKITLNDLYAHVSAYVRDCQIETLYVNKTIETK